VEPLPETRYVKTRDGVYIAYQVMGNGPIDLLYCFGTAVSIDDQVDEWHCMEFLRKLASFSRVIRFDRRGIGLSDPVMTIDENTIEQWIDDAIAVLDAAESVQTTVFGEVIGAQLAMTLAATHPNRVSRLALLHATPRWMQTDDYDIGLPPDEIERMIEEAAEALVLGKPPYWKALSGLGASFMHWYVRAWRRAASPTVMQMLTRTAMTVDLRPVLPAIAVPTAVMRRQTATPSVGRYLAEHIRGAQLIELPGSEPFSFIGDVDALVSELQAFLTGTRAEVRSDRVLVTVLFTDVVDSTAAASRMGDRRWRETLDQYDRIVARELAAFRGKQVKTTGDGTLATFDGPARAIRCATAIRDEIRALDLDLRCGLHTGEVEVRGDDVTGIAVVIGQRVTALAGAGEVLVSSTVKDLVAGSGIRFRERGTHELKGVPDEWRIFVAEA